ncbi:hypothetical protein PsYK624_092340 [Phanerochaete sordida]|uniref:Uncharacterized protein n=1 Tax=Phanerochaete sordida TaxID=48140 RepID=A0A9P3GG26_9APHY|nr:hypothetical protein PsYK624_092340 [Phanerochaete sordida]
MSLSSVRGRRYVGRYFSTNTSVNLRALLQQADVPYTPSPLPEFYHVNGLTQAQSTQRPEQRLRPAVWACAARARAARTTRSGSVGHLGRYIMASRRRSDCDVRS